MRILSLIIALNLFVNASEYFAKLEPLETCNIKASVSGQVVFVNDNIKGSHTKNSTIVQLDSNVDKAELEQIKNKLKTIKQIIKIEQSTLKKFQSIRSKSQLDKDNQKIKVLNLHNQQSDLIIRKVTLEDRIIKKDLKETNNYISDINVKVGDFVTTGTLLYTVVDLSGAKVDIFIPISKASNLTSKKIYIDGKETNYKISKLYRVADVKHISSYKCEIVIDAPKNFSKLVKVEFK